MKNYWKIIILITIALVFIPQIAFADSLQVYLFNNNGDVRFDNMRNPVELQQGTDVLRDQFAEIESQYQIALISANPNSEPIFVEVILKENDFSIETPWYPHLRSLELRKENQVVDSVSLESYNTCNANTICEFERGENENTCLADCVGSAPQYSVETQQTLSSQNGVIRDQEGTVLLEFRDGSNESEDESTPQTTQSGPNIILLVGGLVLIVGAIGYLVYTKVSKK